MSGKLAAEKIKHNKDSKLSYHFQLALQRKPFKVAGFFLN